ncbi:hypothetical protein PAPHI01_2072 [Pancytospora philotis]|nr:hypothetical protein PAPHI01_2072 [Pancytospora philotis]
MDESAAYNDIRSKYCTAKRTKELAKEHKLKFRNGFFSRKELELAQNAVDEFLQREGLPLDALQEHLMHGAAFPLHDLLLHVTQSIPCRTFKSVSGFVAWFYNPLTEKKFDREAELRLLEMVERKGYRWKEIGRELNFVRDACRTRYLELKGLSRSYITVDEIAEIVRKGQVPTDEKGWRELSARLNVSQSTLFARVNKFLKSPLQSSGGDVDTVLLMAHILHFNFYCSLDVDFAQLRGFLEGCAAAYEAERGGHPAPEDQPRGNHYREIFDAHFHKAFPSLDRADLGVEIALDDIFWTNITKEFLVFSTTARTKFYSLVATYQIATFQDLFSAMDEIAYNHFLGEINKSLLAK